ncbi:MAG: CBS domain-containing protein [Acidimicrobiia bacterium]
MSPRAAWRLERLGYTAYDYTAGKVDWLAAGLATVRAEPPPPRAIDAINRDVPTCSPDTPISELDHVRAARAGFLVVVNGHHIVLGRIRVANLGRASAGATAEEVMEPGPATVRADVDLDETRERLRHRGVPHILVTTPEGELLGALSAVEADR